MAKRKKKDSIADFWLAKTVKFLWIGFGVMVLITFLYVFAVKGDWFGLFGGMPSVKSLENPENELASELYSADKVLLGKYYRPNSNRTPAQYQDLSPNLVHALTATEDIRFDRHSGIDPIGILRAMAGVITFNRKGGGKHSFTTAGQKLVQYQTRRL